MDAPMLRERAENRKIAAEKRAAKAAKVISWGVYYHHFHYS